MGTEKKSESVHETLNTLTGLMATVAESAAIGIEANTDTLTTAISTMAKIMQCCDGLQQCYVALEARVKALEEKNERGY